MPDRGAHPYASQGTDRRASGARIEDHTLNDAPTPILLVSLLVLLIVIAFSSGTEVAMLSVNRYRIRHRAQAGERTREAARAAAAKAGRLARRQPRDPRSGERVRLGRRDHPRAAHRPPVRGAASGDRRSPSS